MKAYDPYGKIGKKDFIYTCKSFIGLEKIAKRLGVPVAILKKANNTGGEFRAGDELVVENLSRAAYRVQAGDSLESIAEKFNAEANKIAEFNGVESVFPAQIIYIPDDIGK